MDELYELRKRVKEAYGTVTENEFIEAASESFNLLIDKSRIDDYQITKIDFDKLDIELYDRLSGVVYSSGFISYIDLLSHFSSGKKYNHTIISASTYTIERFYDIERDKIIIEKLRIINGEYTLDFIREYPNKATFLPCEVKQLFVKYVRLTDSKKDNGEMVLLNRSYNNKTNGYYESIYNSRSFSYRIDNIIHKCDYFLNDNVIYCIDDYEYGDDTLRGLCFENTDVDMNEYETFNITPSNYSVFTDKNNISAMVFFGFVGRYDRHVLQIGKNRDNISINYRIRNIDSKEVTDEIITIPSLTSNSISNEEVKLIINELLRKFDNDFINVVEDELFVFGEKIDIRKGNIIEIVDKLDPKLLIDKSLEEVASMIVNNKNEYFNLMYKQLKEILNYDVDEKVLKI